MAAGGAHEMDKLVQGDKYIMQEIQLSDYAVLMKLTIRGLAKHDFGGYVCSSVNVLGKSEGNIRLQGGCFYPAGVFSPCGVLTLQSWKKTKHFKSHEKSGNSKTHNL